MFQSNETKDWNYFFLMNSVMELALQFITISYSRLAILNTLVNSGGFSNSN